MLDRYFEGVVERVSPEAPVPVVRVLRTFDRPGGAANTAVNIAALGGRPMLVGVTGACARRGHGRGGRIACVSGHSAHHRENTAPRRTSAGRPL